MDLSSLRRAYTGHVPDLMGARGGSAVLVPLVDTITGSTTMCFASYWCSFWAMVSMSADDDTMPILTASG